MRGLREPAHTMVRGCVMTNVADLFIHALIRVVLPAEIGNCGDYVMGERRFSNNGVRVRHRTSATHVLNTKMVCARGGILLDSGCDAGLGYNIAY